MSKGGYGFGHHQFLNDFIRENKCRKLMEIGIENGDNAKNMIEAANENHHLEKIEYYGFDTFEKKSQLKIVKKKLNETGCKYKLYEGKTENSLPRNIGQLPKMDIIFIDGGKSYETTLNDWKYSKKLMHTESGVFIHNYTIYSGVKKAVNEINENKYSIEILEPPHDCTTVFLKKR